MIVRVAIAGEKIRSTDVDSFRKDIVSRGFCTLNNGEDADVADWTIYDPYTGVTVGRAYAA